MQIKDENGKIIANIDIQDGFSVSDLIRSINSGKKKKCSLDTLKSIEQGSDHKQILFKFNDGELIYDLPTKNFVRKNGIKIGEGSFKNIKLNINNKLIKKTGSYQEVDNFWTNLAQKTEVPWIKTFFGIIDIWANKRYSNGGWMSTRDRVYRNKIVRLIGDKENKSFLDCAESFAKIPKIQLLDEEGLIKFYDNILSISKNIAREKGLNSSADTINVSLKKSKVDGWFFDRCNMSISENYVVDEVLINYMGDYIKCCDNNFKELFQYTFETYRGVIEYKQIEKIKKLIGFGYEPKRLIDYLYRDIYNQGLSLEFENDWVNALGSLTILYDYANMNEEMRKEYERYPRYLSTYHDITQKNYEIEEDKITKRKFEERIKELKDAGLEYSEGDYTIVLPKNSDDLINEGQSLSHCVASYYKRMATGETNIVFMRKKNSLKDSLVTIEIRDGQIVQAKGKNNSYPKDTEMKFINKYKKYLLSK